MNNIAINLKNVTKEYVIHHEKPTLVEKFFKGKTERFKALDNISLTIQKGERLGIIGPNGSGKTTILKIISGIAAPTSGSIATHGKVVSLIDLEAGFHPELTGEQNIFLNGLLLGLTRQEINRKMLSIIKFSNIGRFIDVPLYTYSSGMKLRLGFSIAIHSNPDILLLDEGFLVGDALFKRKIIQKINMLIKNKATLIIVSHILTIIQQLSTRIIILKSGQIQNDCASTADLRMLGYK